MTNIKSIMTSYLRKVTLSVVIGILVLTMLTQVFSTQRQAQAQAEERFEQIEQILAENEVEYAAYETELQTSHLRSASVIDYLIQEHPEILNETAYFQEIAAFLGVEGISIFDETGTIFAGTEPESFGMTMDDGEQIAFFKPMLEDKTLRLCQEITPNTHSGKQMRYSAVWSQDGKYIVQVGESADGEADALEKYQLSYVFSLLRVNGEAELYAIHPESGEITAASTPENIGKHLSDIGLNLSELEGKGDGFYAKINGVNAYCVFKMIDADCWVGRIIPVTTLYQELPTKAVELILILLLSALILIVSTAKYIDKIVIRNISNLNNKLRAITAGKLEERVELRGCQEFSELSDHINEMTRSLNEKLTDEYQYQDELTEALKLANAANKAKSSFLFSMSHDIRTPMNAILGFSAMAEKYIDDQDKVLDCLKKLRTAGEHLLRLINDVLDMARIESGKVKLDPQPYSIPASMAETTSVFVLEMEKKNLAFTYSCDVQDEVACYDKLRMSQVTLNLLGNALKYTLSGGSVNYTVTQVGPAEDGYATYRGVVKDTGIGMTPEFCRNVFQPFERDHSAAIHGIPGTGLGLSITKKVIEQMGGSITCTSELGVGTEFVFTIKLKVADTAAAQSEEAVQEATEVSFENKRILLAEDNELNLEIACEILRDCGFIVDTAQDGAEALEKVSKAQPGDYDIILMDIQMPKMNGYEAAKAIRQLNDPVLSRIPIIALTANAFDEDQKKATAVGMNGHLAKPIDTEKMMEIIQRFL